MKLHSLIFAILLAAGIALASPKPRLAAQSGGNGHYVTLTWTLSTDDNSTNCPAAGDCSYNIYRNAAACPLPTGLTPLASTANAISTYQDNSVNLKSQYCYAVTFVANGAESVYSNEPQVSIKPFPPSGAAGNPH